MVNARNAKEPVEGAPVVVLGEAQSAERLSYGAPGEGKEVSENEGLSPKKGALLAEGASVGDEQLPRSASSNGVVGVGEAEEVLVGSGMRTASVFSVSGREDFPNRSGSRPPSLRPHQKRQSPGPGSLPGPAIMSGAAHFF